MQEADESGQRQPGLLPQMKQTRDAHTVTSRLPANPFRFIRSQAYLGAGTLGGTVAKTDKRGLAKLAGNEVMFVEIMWHNISDIKTHLLISQPL